MGLKKLLYKNIERISRQLLNTGLRNSNNSIKEAYGRSAVNRAYYATFTIASQKMKDRKMVSDPNYELPTSGKVHADIQKYWRKESTKFSLRFNLGKRIEQLRAQRNKADYRFENPYNIIEAEKYVKIASMIIKELEVIN
jgi:uncharacterized protein (UPF0332 family)